MKNAGASDELINDILEEITYRINMNVKQGLFSKDQLFFTFIMCIQIMLKNNDISKADWEYFLYGYDNIDDQEEDLMSFDKPNYISDDHWNKLMEYIKSNPMVQPVLGTLEQEQEFWKAMIEHPVPFSVEQPELINLSPIQKLNIIKVFQEEKLIQSIKLLLEQYMGSEYLNFG